MGEQQPLGSDSLTWRLFGDIRNGLLIGWTATLQAMHPVISTALVQHSDVFENPVNRLLRSAAPILDVVYGDADAGPTVRNFHVGISGVDDQGERYNALSAEPYYWAHATFVATQYVLCEYFAPALSDAEKEQLYGESITWYARYGLPTDALPPDYAGFRAYWDEMVAGRLIHSEAIRRSALHSGKPTPPPYPWFPAPLWRIVGPPVIRLEMWIARGLLGQTPREALGWSWTERDERRLRRFGRAVEATMRVVPARYRLQPAVRARLRG